MKLINKMPLSAAEQEWFAKRNPITHQDKPPYSVPLMSKIARLPWNGYKVCSTFSGCGGSSLGYKMAGFKVLWASEFIPAAQETYEANHPSTILDKRDIREVQPQDILDATGLEPGELDLFDGSPPCASFSTAGIREEGWGKVKKYSDTEQRTDDLFLEFARLVKGVQPRVFVAENVKGLTIGVAKEKLGSSQNEMFGKPDESDETFLKTLENCGYLVRFRVINAMNYGVPQSRQRVIFIGIRRDLVREFGFSPYWPDKLPYIYTIRDAVPWMHAPYTEAEWASVGVAGSQPEDDNPFPVESESSISRFCTGEEWEKLKIGEQSKKYFSEVKADPDAPSPCICASHGSGGIASVVHPYYKRKFSIAELKRICAFPDDFILSGSYAQQWERLGRAVPPVMMMHVAATIRRTILSQIPKDYTNRY